jgi:CO/xanthine dehydrogenase FAD-binding subunit
LVVSSPASLDEALQELAAHPETVPLAGGTDLMVAINFGRERPGRVMVLGRLVELQQLELSNGRVRCGSGVTYTRMLAEIQDRSMVGAARTVGSPQIRNAGTLGGNLGTCSPAGDTLPVLAALGATVVLASAGGERRLGIGEFMLGPKRSALRDGELVMAAEWEPAGSSQAFLKVGSRNAMVIAVASCALVLDRLRKRVGVGLGSVGPVVVRPEPAERFAEALMEEAGWERPVRPAAAAVGEFRRLVAESARPIDDVRGSAAYRRHVVGVMAGRALERACASP